MRPTRLYDLTIHSAFPLPGVVSAPAGEADVTIERGAIDWAGVEADVSGRRLRAQGEAIAIYWPEGGFLLRAGRQLIVDPIPGVHEAQVALFILGAAMGLLLHQRGLMALHASAVAIDGRGVVFIGPKGWGKSTLAVTLADLGHAVLTDDIAAIVMQSGGPVIVPGAPQIKLWPDTLTALGRRPEDYERLYPGIEKRLLRLAEPSNHEAVPLSTVFCLDGGARLSIEPLSKTDALQRVMSHWYGARYGRGVIESIGLPIHLRQCAELVRQTPCLELRRPPSLGTLAGVAERVVEHVRRGAREI